MNSTKETASRSRSTTKDSEPGCSAIGILTRSIIECYSQLPNSRDLESVDLDDKDFNRRFDSREGADATTSRHDLRQRIWQIVRGFLRAVTKPGGPTRRMLFALRDWGYAVVSFYGNCIRLPLYIPSGIWQHRDVLRTRWTLTECFGRLGAMSQSYPFRGTYFDKFNSRPPVADPVGISFFETADPFFRPTLIWSKGLFFRHSLRMRLALYVPNLLKWSGWFSLAHAIYKKLSTVPGYEAEGFAGMADIAHLFGRWQIQLRDFKERGIHLNAYDLFHVEDRRLLPEDECGYMVAANYYRQALVHAPADPHILTAYGKLIADMEEPKAAADLFQKALDVAPEHYVAAIRLGQMHGLIGDVVQTRRYYSRVIGRIALSDRFQRHVAADIVPMEEACRDRGIRCVEKHAPRRLRYSYEIAYGGLVKDYSTQIDFEPGNLATFENLTDLGLGLILLDDDRPQLIRDSKHLPTADLQMFAPAVQAHTSDRALVSLPHRMQEIDQGPVVVLPGYVNNYFHWIMETLSTLAMLEGEPLFARAKILIHDKRRDWHGDTLALLGIGEDRVIEAPCAPLRIRNAICPTMLSRNTVVHPAAVAYLRKHLARPAKRGTPGKRIYLSREKIGGRKATNEREVRRLVARYGFVSVDSGKMSIAKQQEFFSDVEMIVAPGGAALTNMLFCPEGTKILSLACLHNYEETFSCLAAILNQKFWACLNDGHPTPNPYYLWTPFDFEIDLKNLQNCLDKMIADA